MSASSNAADRLLAKLSAFIAEELDEQERVLLGQLLAPGIEQAYTDEVNGFVMWTTTRLPDSLREAIRDHRIRVVGLGIDDET